MTSNVDEYEAAESKIAACRRAIRAGAVVEVIDWDHVEVDGMRVDESDCRAWRAAHVDMCDR